MTDGAGQAFNVVCVGQAGRLAQEAVLFAASFRAACPGFAGRLIVAEPQPGPLWDSDPRLPAPVRALLDHLGAEVLPFENRHFGQAWPQGNKIELLAALPEAPFVFFDTDTLFTGDIRRVGFDFARPSASMRREATWPVPALYGPGYSAIWKALYDRFGLDFASSLDPTQPDGHWERYLYFNAGWFFHHSPHAFGERFLAFARTIRDEEIPELASQTLFPWLDQIALPLVVQSFGGGRPWPELAGLDGDVTCHYRMIPLLYARESDAAVAALEAAAAANRIKRVLKEDDGLRRLVYQGQGRVLRGLIDRSALPRREQALRQRIKTLGYWYR